MIRDIIRELFALAALATFVVGIGSVGLLVVEHNDPGTAHTVTLAAR
ncbi:hypothetical protein [Aureimonas sp. Leaf324]|nr:hypothetical protein [Aureimonas sp. Leaf324]